MVAGIYIGRMPPASESGKSYVFSPYFFNQSERETPFVNKSGGFERL